MSTDYPSLDPGYGVVYSGRFATQAEANAHTGRLRPKGCSASYARLVVP